MSASMSAGVALLAEPVTPRICLRMVFSGDLAVSSLGVLLYGRVDRLVGLGRRRTLPNKRLI